MFVRNVLNYRLITKNHASEDSELHKSNCGFLRPRLDDSRITQSR
jgi:hypothetical protein